MRCIVVFCLVYGMITHINKLRADALEALSAKNKKQPPSLVPLAPPTKHARNHAQEVWAHPKPVRGTRKNRTQLISHDDGSETASDADRPAGRSLRKTPSSE